MTIVKFLIIDKIGKWLCHHLEIYKSDNVLLNIRALFEVGASYIIAVDKVEIKLLIDNWANKFSCKLMLELPSFQWYLASD